VSKYLGGAGAIASKDEYADPSTGDGYTFVMGAAEPSAGQINYDAGSICGADGVATAGKSRNYVLRIKLEGQTSPYCVDNRS